MYIISIFLFFCTTAFCSWKKNDLIDYYFDSNTSWIYVLKYKNWYYYEKQKDKEFWLFYKDSNTHFNGWIYYSENIKPFSYFVPSYLDTESELLLTLGTWLYHDGTDYLFFNNSLKEWSRNPFIIVWNQYNISTDGGWVNDDLGRFAWDDAYALEGISMLNNQMPSIEIERLGNSIITRFFDGLNSKRNIDDDITGKFKEGWASTRYTDGKYHTWNVHTCRIINAIGQFYLSTDFVSRNNIDQLEEIFAYIKEDWINLETGGYFNEIYLEKIDVDVPFNMVAEAGSACLTLYTLTQKTEYLNYATDIFLHIQNYIEIIDDCAVWPYKTNSSINKESFKLGDDISHAACVIRFIKNCLDQGMNFQSDLTQVNFENTFSKLIQSDGSLNKYIYATTERYSDEKYDRIIAPYWAFILSKERFGLYFDFNSNKSLNYDPNSFLNHFGKDLILNYVTLNSDSLNQ